LANSGETNSLHHNNSNSLRNSPTAVSRLEINNSNNLIGDGPPTPEMDLNSGSEHRRRKLIAFNFIKYLIKIVLQLTQQRPVLAACRVSCPHRKHQIV
jgi:hypothetical protein